MTLQSVDLFSGIGGFALACAANGIETACFVEKDQRCRDFLSKTWPGVPIYDDVKTFDGTEWANAFLLTGGVPCQPASRAGKQRGAADDRWLWPEAIRILGEVRPAWCLFENPPGIGDVGLAGILADVAAQGYQVRVFGIPACAVGAPHRRMRYWIVGRRVADSTSEGRRFERGEIQRTDDSQLRKGAPVQRTDSTGEDDLADTERDGGWLDQPERPTQGRTADGWSGASVANTERPESRGGTEQGPSQGLGRDRPAIDRAGLWSDFVWVPGADGKLRRAPGDTVSLVDGLHRSLLGGLGNSICWPVAAEIIRAMLQTDTGARMTLDGSL